MIETMAFALKAPRSMALFVVKLRDVSVWLIPCLIAGDIPDDGPPVCGVFELKAKVMWLVLGEML